MKKNRLSHERFEAFVGYTRLPNIKYITSEIAWFANENETVLFTVLFCHIDFDFNVIVLARNEQMKFICVDVSESFGAYIEAEKFIHEYTKVSFDFDKLSSTKVITSKNLFDEFKNGKMLHEGFRQLKDSVGLFAARGIISEIINHYYDVDGNFVEQFQTTGFNSRIFELYLFSALTELNFNINREYEYPDYIVEKADVEIAIEAVTVNPSETLKFSGSNEEDMFKHFMPIKWGSSLYSKLTKKYWEKEHVKGKPFVIAIADFHDDHSMIWSGTSLIYYLYGVEHSCFFDENGTMQIEAQKIGQHVYGNKIIDSGFFLSEDAKNISAVLFSATATISKFNRMGIISGFGHPDVHVIRQGATHMHNMNSPAPLFFTFSVMPKKYCETWGEGLNMYHNPQALYPIDIDLFPNISHHRMLDNGLIESVLPPFSPYSSIDRIIKFSNRKKHFDTDGAK